MTLKIFLIISLVVPASKAIACNGREDNCGKTITQIMIPGAHNAGSYDLKYHKQRGDMENDKKILGAHLCHHTSAWAWLHEVVSASSQNHDRTIYEMLSDGIRYLDLDTCADGVTGELYTCHCLFGKKMADILHDVKIFLDGNKHEVVVLDFGNGLKEHRCGSTRANLLAALVSGVLGSYLAPRGHLSKRLSELIRDEKRVLVIWRHPTPQGAWSIPEEQTTGNYSGKEDKDKLLSDQKKKLANREPGKLHLVNWFLTLTSWQPVFDFRLGRRWQADSHEVLVDEFFDELKGKPSVVMLDFYRKKYPDLPQKIRDLK